MMPVVPPMVMIPTPIRTVVAGRRAVVAITGIYIVTPIHINRLRTTMTPGSKGGSGCAADGASYNRTIAPAQFGTYSSTQRSTQRSAENRIAPAASQQRRGRDQ